MRNLLILFSFFVLSCTLQAQQAFKLPASGFRQKLDSVPERQLLDVRTPEEYATGYISGAKNVNVYDNDFLKQLEGLDKNKPVFVYCKGGGRSASAVKKMQADGFATVYELQGGIMAWEHNDYSLETQKRVSASGVVTTEDFKTFITSEQLVLVDFYATWCMPCKKMEPVLAALEKDFKDKMSVKRIDVDAAKTLTRELSVQEAPTFILYKKGKEVKRITGLLSEKKMRSIISSEL